MKYSIQETGETISPYKLFRYDEYAGVPNNAELEFWMRIQELEDVANHTKRHNDYLIIQNEDLEARNKILIETGHWIGQDEAHDLKIAVEKFLLYTRLGRIGVGNKQFWDTPDWQIQDLSKALNNCKIKK